MRQTWRWFGPGRDPISLDQVREAGATGIVSALHQIPGGTAWTLDAVEERKALIEAAGLSWSVVESIPVTNAIKSRSAEWRKDVDAWKDSLRALGVHEIAGDVVGDGSYFDDEWTGVGWTDSDLEAWYGVPIGALDWAENMVTLRILPGEAGGPARIATRPETRGLAVENRVKTVRNGATSVRITRARDRLVAEGQVRRGGSFTRTLPVVDPANYAAAVPRILAQQYAMLLKERRKGAIALLPSAAFAPKVDPAAAQLNAFYTAHRTDYLRPERRVLRYATFGEEALGTLTPPTDAQIAARYQRDAAQYQAKQTRTFTQLVVPTEAAAKAVAAEVGRGTPLDRPRVFLMQPYDPQRLTVVMIHGLASSPEAWVNLANEVLGDEALRKRYQIWEVYYPTNTPIPVNLVQIRAALVQTFAALDPGGHAPASHHVTLIGHSMGGVIARLLVVDGGDTLWQRLFQAPARSVRRKRLDVLAPYLTIKPLPGVDEAIFLAAPHAGTPVASQWLARLANALIRLPRTLLDTSARIADALAGELPEQAALFRTAPTGVNLLRNTSPYLEATSGLPIAPGVRYHSIIARRSAEGPLETSSDGFVPYASAHLPGAASEKVIVSGHSVQETPQAILEIRRILREHAGLPQEDPASPGAAGR